MTAALMVGLGTALLAIIALGNRQARPMVAPPPGANAAEVLARMDRLQAEAEALRRDYEHLVHLLTTAEERRTMAALASLGVPDDLQPVVIREARAFELDPLLLGAVGAVESQWHLDARGDAGEVGPMQILPATGEWIAGRLGLETYDLSDPETNIRFAAYYLSTLLRAEQGDLARALAAYNAGPTGWDRIPVSRGYAARVLARAMSERR